MRCSPLYWLLGNLRQEFSKGSDGYLSKDEARNRLKAITGQDFGYRVSEWELWVLNHPDEFRKGFFAAERERSALTLSRVPSRLYREITEFKQRQWEHGCRIGRFVVSNRGFQKRRGWFFGKAVDLPWEAITGWRVIRTTFAGLAFEIHHTGGMVTVKRGGSMHWEFFVSLVQERLPANLVDGTTIKS